MFQNLKAASSTQTLLKSFFLLVISTCLVKQGAGQIYQHDFGTIVITGDPYTVAPSVFDAHLLNSSWTNSSSSWTSFSGSTGQAIALNNSTGTPVITITFDVAPGYQADITGFSFWRQRSSTGAQNWAMDINGVAVGSGAAATTGSNTGLISVSNSNNLTGMVKVVLTLSGASGTGTFRIDDFTLNGSVTTGATLAATTPASFADVCTNSSSSSGSFSLTGTSLSPSNVMVAPLNGFTYSVDNTTFSPSLSLSQPGGSYNKTIFVRLTPLAIQSYDGNITVSGGAATPITVAVVGNGVNTMPSINAGTVANITTSSADINVNISSTGCSALSSYGIEYSVNPGFANGTGSSIAGGSVNAGNFTVNLAGLAPEGQVFYFHSYASNSGGITYQAENSLTLSSTSPSSSVPSAGAGSLAAFGNVCVNTAIINSFNLSGSTLNGSNISIGPLSHYSFAVTAGGTFSNSLILSQGGSGYNYSGGALSGCTIYVRFIPTSVQAYNGNISISGGGAPAIMVGAAGSGINSIAVVSTGNAYSITTATAILPGSVSDAGCGVTLGYGIEYSNSPFTPGTGTQVAGSNFSGTDFSVSLALLNPNSTYYYYAYVTNAAGLSYGSSKTFTTFPVPSKLVILSVSPASPTALTPFSVTIQAQDNAGNPVDVTSNTSLNFLQSAGSGIFTFPNSPAPAGSLPAGANTITITDLSYDVVENSVGISVKASAGMTILGTSNPKLFNVTSYAGSSTFTWSLSGGSAWLTGSSWNTGTAPGSSTPGLNQHVACFSALAALSQSAVGGCGINMNSVGGAYDAGTIYFTNTYDFNHVNNVVPIGNSSTTQTGTLTLWGAGMTNVGGITGNNFSSVLIANYMTGSTTNTLDIKNTVGSGSQSMILNLASPGAIVAGPGRSINISTVMAGAQNLILTGGGACTLTPSGVASVNSFTGMITIANGILIAGNSGAFNTANPNVLVLGSGSTGGILRLNGHNVVLGGLSTSGTAGNIVENGNAAATLTVNNAAGYSFNGMLKDGSAGALSFTKNGIGIITLNGANTYTGVTTVNAGTLILARPGGSTLPVQNSVNLGGSGILRISSDQTLKNLTLANGTSLVIDAGITLTITGNYLPANCNIANGGTIVLGGLGLQSFPGATAAVSTMNNLTVNNVTGVSLNASLNIVGALNILSGTFTVGAYTLTLNKPIMGNSAGFTAGGTSSIILAGTAPNLNIPSGVSQLKNLTVSNSIGTALQSDLNISSALFITNTAGMVDVGTNRLYGSANTTMSGGTLKLSRNAAVLPELSGIYLLTGGSVLFSGVGIGSNAQIIRPINYFNLASSGNGDRELSGTGITGISNSFTPNLPSNNYSVINSIVDYNKTGLQSVASFKYYDLMLSGGSNYTKTLAGNIDVQGTLTMATSTKLALGNFNISLKSDAANSAAVAPINTVNSITYGTGRFVVERYVPTGLSHGKSWQLLAVPVSGSQSVNNAWQEGNTPLANGTANFGTTISSEKAGATSRGYDFYTPSGPSIKTYNPATGGWEGIDNGTTNTSGLNNFNKRGYMVFVRGDRSVQTSSASATATTLRAVGKLYAPGTDAPFSTNVTGGKFESVGNPYVSSVDFLNILASSTGIDSKFYVWDPLLPGSSGYGYGGYQLLSSVNLWKPVPGGTNNYPSNIPYSNIQSGQAFFIFSTNGGTVNFSESNKTSGSSMVYRNAAISNRRFLRADLYSGTGNLVDGNVLATDPDFSNNVDADDALKQLSLENFGIRSHGNLYALDARKLVSVNDTVFYSIPGLGIQQFQFRFAPENFASSALKAWLIDTYTGTQNMVSLSDSTKIDFSITADPASRFAERFYLVFKTPKSPDQPTTPDSSTIEISAKRQNDHNIDIVWTCIGKKPINHFDIQRSNGRKNFATIASVPAGQLLNGGNTYKWTDSKPEPAINTYRIIAVTDAASSRYSGNARVDNIKTKASLDIFPNPITGKVVNLSFKNVEAGDYSLEISNMAGTVIYRKVMTIRNIDQLLSVYVKNISAGYYQVKISGQGTTLTKDAIVE